MHIGIGAALSVFIMAIPLAVLFSSIQLMIASFAKTSKEAQTYLVPLIFIVIIRNRRHGANRPYAETRTGSHPERQPALQRACHRHVPLELHRHHFTSTCAYAAVALFCRENVQRESVLFRS